MRDSLKHLVRTSLVVVCITGLPSSADAQYRKDVPQFSPMRALAPTVSSASISPATSDRPVSGQTAADQTSVPDLTDDSIQSPTNGPVSPAGALYRSLVLPGWGQWKNGRKGKALFFAVAEAVCIGGYLYENARYTSGDYTGPDKEAVKTDRNSFLLYWMIAKVLDIMDAYVDAQFQTYDVSDITPPDLAR